jgi:sugar phosphate isomerase/epimerase
VGLGHTDFAPIAEGLRQIGYQGYASAEILPLPDGDAAARKTIESFRQWFRPE